MNDWIVARNSVIVFEKPHKSLRNTCTIDAQRCVDNEVYTALKADYNYLSLMQAVFIQALMDYFDVSSDPDYRCKLSHERLINNAKRYIKSIDSLSFCGYPNMSGEEFIEWVTSDWERFAEIRYILRNFYHSRNKFGRVK